MKRSLAIILLTSTLNAGIYVGANYTKSELSYTESIYNNYQIVNTIGGSSDTSNAGLTFGYGYIDAISFDITYKPSYKATVIRDNTTLDETIDINMRLAFVTSVENMYPYLKFGLGAITYTFPSFSTPTNRDDDFSNTDFKAAVGVGCSYLVFDYFDMNFGADYVFRTYSDNTYDMPQSIKYNNTINLYAGINFFLGGAKYYDDEFKLQEVKRTIQSSDPELMPETEDDFFY